MKADLQFDFLVDRDKSTLTIVREFAAKRQLVWECHTKSELLDRWFAPTPLVTKTKSMEFRDGGHWHYAMVDPEGQEYWGRLDYLTIRPLDGYAALDGFSDETGALNPDPPRSRWDVEFTDAGPHCAHCLVRTVVSYASAQDLETVIGMGMKEGLTATLDRLDELLLTLNG